MVDLVEMGEDILDLLLLLGNQEDLVEEWETFRLDLKVVVMQEVMIHQKEIMEELELMLHLHLVVVEVVELVP